MMQVEVDAITLRVIVNAEYPNRYSVKLSSPFINEIRFDDIDIYDRLKSLSPEVRRRVEEYMPLALKASISTTLAARLLQDLKVTGDYALRILLGGESADGRVFRFRQFFRRVLVEAPRTHVPVLTVISPVDIPIEIMTALNIGPGAGIVFHRMAGAPIGAIQLAARDCFTGFNFAVRRVESARPTERTLTRDSHGQISLSLYWYHKLNKSDDLREYLGTHQDLHVAAPRPLPGQSGDSAKYDVAQSLVEHVSDGTGIVKIWCHCRTDSVSSLTHKLVLAARRPLLPSREIGVTVESLYSAQEVNAPQADLNESRTGPLAYISACQAANSMHHSPATIPQAFIDAGYRTVIAPQVSIGADSAYAMAKAFFERLSRPGLGATVGSALVDARNSIMQAGNPVGLLYVCYGEPSLTWAGRMRTESY